MFAHNVSIIHVCEELPVTSSCALYTYSYGALDVEGKEPKLNRCPLGLSSCIFGTGCWHATSLSCLRALGSTEPGVAIRWCTVATVLVQYVKRVYTYCM